VRAALKAVSSPSTADHKLVRKYLSFEGSSQKLFRLSKASASTRPARLESAKLACVFPVNKG
jgi:hypothetical protein